MCHRLLITTSILLSIFALSIGQDKPYGLKERIPNTSLIISSTGDTLAEMDLRRVFPGFSFSSPVYMTHAADGSERLFVVEKRGVIKVFQDMENPPTFSVFLDIQTRVNSSYYESGLLSMAFHPQYPDSNKFYVYYNGGDLDSRISEFAVSTNPDSADAASERILLQVVQPATNHNGGQITFGPDGYLYIALGDGGSGGDPWGNAQNPTNLLGAILRIDVDRTEGDLAYAIPVENPFIDHPDDWRPEIWAYGLRNPWRYSFDRLTGDLWAGDVGQGVWEEVDLIQRGNNYGWNIMEGFHCYPPGSTCDTTGLTLPVVEYNHSQGRSITGGYVYRGSRLARLEGVYLYGDFSTRKIWGLKREQGQIIENKLIATSPSPIASFAENESGEVFVVGYDGRIYVFEEKPGTAPVDPIPQTISSSGLFSQIDSLILSPGLIPYSVNSPFWSDGADKTRIIALPDTSQIIFDEQQPWLFPPSAVIVKNFFLNMTKGDPASRKIIETRFLVKQIEGEQWDGYSYLWNDQTTDATLLDSSYTRLFQIQDGDTTIMQSYYYPSRSECLVCHTPAAGYVLGLRTSQINKQHVYISDGDSIPDNQLRSYNHIELFTNDIGEDYSNFPRLPDPADTNQTLALRARAYLESNCANCHIDGGSGRTNMKLSYHVPLEEMEIVDVAPTFSNFGIEGAMRLKPGSADSSMIYLRMLRKGVEGMPPLATSVIDLEGSTLIGEWINSLDVITDITSARNETFPKTYRVYPAFPNPFNPLTTIRFDLPETTDFQVKIFDIRGREVELLFQGNQPAGTHAITWNATSFASGVYIYVFKSARFQTAGKILLLK